ncbi:Scramblase-domain-containing protein [Penicillium chermesinum]|nr:Scramblase-domain-containing protein [Penicillium chermesinum]
MWALRLRLSPLRDVPARRAYSTLRSRNSRHSSIRPERIPSARRAAEPSQEPQNVNPDQQETPNINYDPAQNTLLSPVYIPEDPNGVLKETHPATNILSNSGLVIQRQIEMMNVLIGFEQANRYVIMDAQGNHVGYIAEQEKGMGSMMARQWFHTHRSFVTHVFDRHENEVLRFHRPFSWINSRIKVYDPLDHSTAYNSSTGLQHTPTGSLVLTGDTSNTRVSPLGFDQMRVIGEAQQQWAPLRRKYNLFTYHQSPNPALDMGTQNFALADSGLSKDQQTQLTQVSPGGQGVFNQFAYVNEPFLSWDFSLLSADNRLIGSVNRNFVGFARELFTDTGVYALRMDSAGLGTEAHRNESTPTGMTLDQRAVMLATAVSIDFDYFSRHSGSGEFGFMPMWFPGMGGGATAGEAAGGAVAGEAAGGAAAGGAAAGEAGAITGTAGGAIGNVGTASGGIAEGVGAGVAGAGAMAGYEAMQRGMSGQQSPQDIPPEQSMPPHGQQPPDFYEDKWPEQEQDDFWGREDPWGGDGEDGDGGDGDGFGWF